MSIYGKYRFFMRNLLINSKQKKRLTNKNFSIICNDCVAGVLCKDLGIRMNSPTRNLYIYPNDYLKLCSKLDYYLQQDLKPDKNHNNQCLTAYISDIKLYLVHYNNFDEAKATWNRRKKRINKKNLFFMLDDRNGLTKEHIKQFEMLPYKNKLCLTHIPYPQYPSTLYVPGYENDDCVGILSDYVSPWSIKKHYDKIDFVNWLNNK